MKSVNGSSIEYFGDLDGPGLEIPARFNSTLKEALLDRVQPSFELYEWLLRNGIRRPSVINRTTVSRKVLDWLPPSLHNSVDELFAAGMIIPQESLGTEALRTFS